MCAQDCNSFPINGIKGNVKFHTAFNVIKIPTLSQLSLTSVALKGIFPQRLICCTVQRQSCLAASVRLLSIDKSYEGGGGGWRWPATEDSGPNPVTCKCDLTRTKVFAVWSSLGSWFVGSIQIALKSFTSVLIREKQKSRVLAGIAQWIECQPKVSWVQFLVKAMHQSFRLVHWHWSGCL